MLSWCWVARRASVCLHRAVQWGSGPALERHSPLTKAQRHLACVAGCDLLQVHIPNRWWRITSRLERQHRDTGDCIPPLPPGALSRHADTCCTRLLVQLHSVCSQTVPWSSPSSVASRNSCDKNSRCGAANGRSSLLSWPPLPPGGKRLPGCLMYGLTPATRAWQRLGVGSARCALRRSAAGS